MSAATTTPPAPSRASAAWNAMTMSPRIPAQVSSTFVGGIGARNPRRSAAGLGAGELGTGDPEPRHADRAERDEGQRADRVHHQPGRERDRGRHAVGYESRARGE